MLLKSLDIQGFKSFPDKTRLSFGSGITAVVGPNGSGKSNISDAVRWVMGEQSTKTLRGSRMEDIIFGGTKLRGAVGFAQVSLTIDNTSKMLDIETDEVTITRKLYRSGESEYRINNNAVRLRDIYELFMDTGLGRDGYSIIGQGRIAEIVSAKSAERREIFEEASGISKYRYRKNEAERKLDQTQENLVRLFDILTELEDRVEPLRIQSEKAQQFLVLAEQRRQLEVSLYVRSLEKAREALREQENRVMVCKAACDGVDEELAAMEADINAIFAKSQQCAVLMEQRRTQRAGIDEELSRFEAQVAVLRNDIHHKTESIERVRREIEANSLAVSDIAMQIEQRMELHAQKCAQIEELKAQCAEREQTLEDFLSDSARHSERLEEVNKRMAELGAAISQSRVAELAGQSALDELAQRRTRTGEQLAAKEQEASQCEKERAEASAFIAELSEKIEAEANTVKGYAFKLEKRREKLEQSAKEVSALDLRIKEKHQNARLLENLERSMEGFAQSVKTVMNMASRGTLRGVLGPVSSLIEVPRQYTTAIETALSFALQNIVVEDEAAAKNAIAQLKSEKAGRATFLPVSTIKGSRLDERPLKGQAGYIGIAGSLVTCDKRYDDVIASLLGRIAVCDNLDNAAAMAKASGYRFRVVTLDGQVVNAGGSLTGGSAVKSAGLLSRRGDIARLRDEAGKLEVKLTEANTAHTTLKNEIAAIEAQYIASKSVLETMQEDRQKAEMQYTLCERNLAEISRTIEEATAELARAEKRKQELAAELQEARRKLADSTVQMTALEEQVGETAQKKDELRQKRHALTDEISQLKMSIIALTKEAEGLSQSAEELTQRRDSESGKSHTLLAEIAALEAEIAGINEKSQEILLSKQKISEQAVAIEQQTAALAQQRMELERQANDRRASEREILSRREEISKEMARLEERKLSAQGEYDSVIAKLWDEYELTKTEAAAVAQEIPNITTAQRTLAEIKGKIKALGSVNVGAIDEYKEVSERYTFLKEQIDDVTKSRDELQRLISELTSKMREIFTESFVEINRNFGEVFVELFGGGSAHLSLSDEGDVLESGIEINVEPPGKIIKNLSALSGGEQAFVAIAIYFAILKVRPAPFCLLDEIEAALDDVNVTKYAQYLHRLCDKTQFIAITHRRGTMEEADVLYGVTMQEEGVSKLLQLKVTELESKLGLKNT